MQYIRGERRGREARDVELRALTDPCFRHALSGYERHPGTGSEKARDIAELGSRISGMVSSGGSRKMIYIILAVAILAVAGAAIWWISSGSERGASPTVTKTVREDAPEAVSQPTDEIEDDAPVETEPVIAVDSLADAQETEIAPAMTDDVIPEPEKEIEQQKPEVKEVEEEKTAPLADTQTDTATAESAPGDGFLPLFTINQPDGKPVSLPQVGKKQYNEYLRRAMDMAAAGGAGDVVMTFRVNQYGRPSDIRADKGFSREANREAIRLLGNGPEWKPSGDERISITIHFR